MGAHDPQVEFGASVTGTFHYPSGCANTVVTNNAGAGLVGSDFVMGDGGFCQHETWVMADFVLKYMGFKSQDFFYIHMYSDLFRIFVRTH